jgi:hypothetical protein
MGKQALNSFLIWMVFGSSSIWAGHGSMPDISGTWILDKERSDLKSPPLGTSQSKSSGTGGGRGGRSSRSGGGGIGGGGMGGGSMGGSHGGGRGGSGKGGSTSRETGINSPMKLDLDFYQIEEAVDKLAIQQNDALINVKLSSLTDNQTQITEFKYLVNGKTYQKKMADGGLIKSKTSWEGTQLVTKSKEQSALGFMEIVESRSLSADENTLTINLSFKGSSSHWTEKAVYTKAKPELKEGENDK